MTTRGFVFSLSAAALCVAVSSLPKSERPSRSRSVPPQPSTSSRLPERPRRSVDIRAVATAGRTIHVKAGGDLQAAIDDARLGDSIELEPGATYRGPFTLRRKDGSGWIQIGSTVPPPSLAAG